MMMIRFGIKLLLLPVLAVTGILWVLTKAAVWVYGIFHGFSGIAIAIFLLLFLGFREWTNAIVMLGIATALFMVLFIGVFVQEVLTSCTRGIWNFIIT